MSRISTQRQPIYPSNRTDLQSYIDLGTLPNNFTTQGFLNNRTNAIDVYRFSLSTFGSLIITLPDVGHQATLKLIRDVNQNHRVETGEIVTTSHPHASYEEDNAEAQVAAIEGLGAGTYFLQVIQTASENEPFETLPYRLDLAFRDGVRDFEIEPNNTLDNANPIDGKYLNGPRYFRGFLDNDTDPIDLWRFQVDQPSCLRASLTGLASGAELDLLDKFGQVILSGRPCRDSLDREVVSKRIDTGTYFLRVTKFDIGNTPYDLFLGGFPIAMAQLSVTVKHVKAVSVSDIPGGQTDFYTDILIDGVSKRSLVGRDRTSADLSIHNDTSPEFTFTREVKVNQRIIPFSITVYDHDAPIAPIKPITTDAEPDRAYPALMLTYDTTTGSLSGPGVYAHQVGDIITLQGNTPGCQALITFRVSYNTFVT